MRERISIDVERKQKWERMRSEEVQNATARPSEIQTEKWPAIWQCSVG